MSVDCTAKGHIKLRCRKDTVRLLCRSVLDKCNWYTILCGHYSLPRSILKHCDVIGLQ